MDTKEHKEDIAFDDFCLFKKKSVCPLSLSLPSRSLSLGAHFVFSPIGIHQQSTLLRTQGAH